MFIITIKCDNLTTKDVENLKNLFGNAAADEFAAGVKAVFDGANVPSILPAPEPEPNPSHKAAKYPYRRPAGWKPDQEFMDAAKEWQNGVMTQRDAAKQANMTENQFKGWCQRLNIHKRPFPGKKPVEPLAPVYSDQFVKAAKEFKCGKISFAVAWKRSGLPITEFANNVDAAARQAA